MYEIGFINEGKLFTLPNPPLVSIKSNIINVLIYLETSSSSLKHPQKYPYAHIVKLRINAYNVK